MKYFSQWFATMLIIGVFFALSYCGMAMAPATVHAGTMMNAMSCVNDGCSSSNVSCLTQCIQKLDRAQQGVVAEIVSVLAIGALFIFSADRFGRNLRVAYFWASSWRHHRLFVLRE